MKPENKVVIAIFVFSMFLASLGVYFKNIEYKQKPLTPYSDSFDLFSLLVPREKPKYTIYGYLPYWNLDKVKYLQLDKLTDIAYFGIYINADGTFKKYMESDEGLITEPGYNNWLSNDELDVLISASKKHGVRFALTIIAHSDEDNDAFLNCRSCWDTLLDNTVKELNNKGITDVNLNFEYAEATEEDSAKKFVEFTAFMNDGLDKKMGSSKLVVSAFADSVKGRRISSQISDLAKVADGIFVMAYDFHTPNSQKAGPVSPISGKGVHSEYDIETMIKDYLSVTTPSKLILGLPYYGYNWVVSSSAKYAERLEGNEDIGFSQSQTYAVIMDYIAENRPEVLWDDLAQVPYYTYLSSETGSTRQVYFENARSLNDKYLLAKANNFAGIGIWALGYDEGYTDLWNLLYEQFIR